MNYAKHTNGSRAANYRAARTPAERSNTLLRQARCDSSLKSIAFAASLGTLRKLAEWMPQIIAAGFVLFMIVALGKALIDYLDMPTVYESWTDRECVRVEAADGTPMSCDDLPTKFHHVWVE